MTLEDKRTKAKEVAVKFLRKRNYSKKFIADVDFLIDDIIQFESQKVIKRELFK